MDEKERGLKEEEEVITMKNGNKDWKDEKWVK